MANQSTYIVTSNFGHIPKGLWFMDSSAMPNFGVGLSALTSGGGVGTAWGQPSILPGVPDGYSVYHSSATSTIGSHADNALFDVTTGFTLACWIKPDALYGSAQILYRQDTYSLVNVNSSANASADVSDTANSAGNAIIPNELYFRVVTWDGAVVKNYLNGVVVGVGTSAGAINTANIFYFGINPAFGGVNGFVGYMQYPAYYQDICLTQDEIRALYQCGVVTTDEAADHSILAMPYSRDALASDVDRTYAIFSNGSDVDVWVKKGTNALVGEGVLIPPRERHRIENYTGAISVIADTRIGGKLVGIETG